MEKERVEVIMPEGIHAEILASFQKALALWSPESDWVFRTSPSIARPRIGDHSTTESLRVQTTGEAEARHGEVQAKLIEEWTRVSRTISAQ